MHVHILRDKVKLSTKCNEEALPPHPLSNKLTSEITKRETIRHSKGRRVGTELTTLGLLIKTFSRVIDFFNKSPWLWWIPPTLEPASPICVLLCHKTLNSLQCLPTDELRRDGRRNAITQEPARIQQTIA
ncbi:hypothetical protein RRG08_015133 [Elysia crispata]|uniref:Uncharacterized protein n=1 Tax=Elysia crispata TaxID=231223 RepID=A0AAE1DMT3_9GAST|nr:hypothetical protein RRG08_015133 [Elysia crispata]